MVKVFTNAGYIVSIMHGAKEGNISDAEYQAIMDKVNRKPTPPDGYDYRLTTSLEWELYERPSLPETSEDTDPELSAEEALNIIMGGTV